MIVIIFVKPEFSVLNSYRIRQGKIRDRIKRDTRNICTVPHGVCMSFRCLKNFCWKKC